MNATDPKSPHPLAEVDVLRNLKQQARETVVRLADGKVPPDMEAIELERLAAVRAEIHAIEAKWDPPLADLPPDVATMDAREAAREVAKLRAEPETFSGWVPPGKRAAAEARTARLQHLSRRAMDLPADIARKTPEAARAEARELRERMATGRLLDDPAKWSDQRAQLEARAAAETELQWLDFRAAGGRP